MKNRLDVLVKLLFIYKKLPQRNPWCTKWNMFVINVKVQLIAPFFNPRWKNIKIVRSISQNFMAVILWDQQTTHGCSFVIKTPPPIIALERYLALNSMYNNLISTWHKQYSVAWTFEIQLGVNFVEAQFRLEINYGRCQ